ncbi:MULTISPECIES: SRPBCC family protein [Amycolatopsis]|uniref:Carbon monoxide dehydrogenase subunit G n=1 Tax=Amycolatopsis echigonensis TaxID=2576905 RepID=A0A2N3WNR7_9PSEU|nr:MULTISPECIES: SRPBCC family protein [Amycolatopsis]PKV95502.1 carbon monoxide dehydrogenase subunit G [Amycolatopsis niigatensis]
MQIMNELKLPVPPEQAWPVLMDLERIAPCLPGAAITGVDGDTFEGKAKIKVGPITAEYKGSAEFVERDESAHRAVIKATGRDARGQGNVSASIAARLLPDGVGSKVVVETDLNITGKVAQFGRGVIEDAATAIVGTFAERLAELMAGAPATSSPAGDTGAPVAAVPSAAQNRQADADEALDLIKVARKARAERSRSTGGWAAVVVSVAAAGVSVAAAANVAGPAVVSVIAASIGSLAAGYSLGRSKR